MFGNLYLSHHIGDPDMIGNQVLPQKSLEIPPIQTGISVGGLLWHIHASNIMFTKLIIYRCIREEVSILHII